MNWFPLAVVLGAIIFVGVWYIISYRPWFKRLWEDHAPMYTPDPFAGENDLEGQELDAYMDKYYKPQPDEERVVEDDPDERDQEE